MSHTTLFLCGDVMTGRGIDQILPRPSDPVIHEPFMRSALGYVELAEAKNGPIDRPVDVAYVWGDALEEFKRVRPHRVIVNLETAVTTSGDWQPKGINYRMHPDNVGCLNAAGVDCCVLANNHVLDWGVGGLLETLATLRSAGISTAGAGPRVSEAWTPAALPVSGGRVLVFSCGMESSGIPPQWAATEDKAGVAFIPGLSARSVQRITDAARAQKRPGDLVVASLHWGGNWGYRISSDEVRFAHALVDGGVDIVHGHSSHHPKAIEVYRDKLILYGCGDLLTDYEGITGHEEFRGDLGLMYFPTVDSRTGTLQRLQLVPTQMKRMRVSRVSAADATWQFHRLNRECAPFGTSVEAYEDHGWTLRWRTTPGP
jgi:poly-gamma-glutamate synthesis protein (capsule biosynthesis protein)